MKLKHALEETPTGFVALHLRADCHLIVDRSCKILGYWMITQPKLIEAIGSLDSADLANTHWYVVTRQETLKAINETTSFK